MDGGLLAIACGKIAKLDVPAFIKDSELRFVAVNSAFAAFSGHDQAELVGRRISALTDRPEDRAWEDMERRALVFADEQLALCFDQTGRDHCRVQIERFVTEDENLFVFGVFRERPKLLKTRMSKRNRDLGHGVSTKIPLTPVKDSALQTTEAVEDFHGVLDALPLGVLLLDRDLRIVHCNGAARELLAPFDHALIAGGDYDVLVDAIVQHAFASQARYDRHELIALAVTDGAAQRIVLNDKIVHVSTKHLASGAVVLRFADATQTHALEHDSKLYRNVLENVPQPVFLRDGDRRLIFANAAYEQMVGGDRSRFYGLREDEMFADEGEEMRRENLTVLQTGVDVEREQLVAMPNGVKVPLLTSLKRIEDADGEPYIVGTLADISILKVSERQKVEAQVQAKTLNQKFETILRTMPVGVVILDADLTISFANAKLKRIVNWPDGKAIHGVSFADYVRHIFENGWPLTPGPDLETRIANRCAEMRNLTGTQQVERMVSDGRYVLVSMTLLEHGQFLITYSDYTEQRLREREITEARAQLEDVGMLLKEATHVMMQGLCVVQQDKILYANDKLAEILDVPAAMTAEGANWRDLYDYCSARGDIGEDPAGFLERVSCGLQDEKNASSVFQRSDGIWINLEALASSEDRWLFVVSDISEPKKREAELTMLAEQAEAADKAKSRFLASMGHEIRTPMSSVLGMAELLASSELDARQKTFVDVILKSGRSLLTIINDILDFAKIDDRSLSLRKVPFDPLAAVEDVILLLAGRAAEKDIELQVRGGGELKHVVASDAGRFRQILTKLVDEAIKATDKGHVLVDLSENKVSDELLWLTVRIEDTGRGFTPEQHQLAFSRFSQFDEPPSFHKAGAGLSLSIVGGLVNLFGGTVAIDSDVGQGAVITVRLPLAIASEKISERSALHLHGARILALASNSVTCGILNEQLQRWGFDGLALSEQHVAFGVLREAIVVGQATEVLVVDFHRADDGAMEFVRKVRQEGLFNQLAIIALLPASLSGLQVELEEMGVQAQLYKPVADTLLRSAISDVLRAARRATRPASNSEDVPVPVREPPPLQPVVSRLPHQIVGKNLLIVDADDGECDAFRQILSDEGIGYDIFASEEQAFAVWQQRRPPVMLIDLSRSDRDALDFVRFIRSEEARTPDFLPTVLIGLSSNASAHGNTAYLKAGLDDLLIKPVSGAVLLACIRQWSNVGRPKQRAAL